MTLKKLTREEKESLKKKNKEQMREDKKDYAAFKDLVKRARKKDALIELILPDGETSAKE